MRIGDGNARRRPQPLGKDHAIHMHQIWLRRLNRPATPLSVPPPRLRLLPITHKRIEHPRNLDRVRRWESLVDRDGSGGGDRTGPTGQRSESVQRFSGVRAVGSHTGLTMATRIVMLHPSCASAWW